MPRGSVVAIAAAAALGIAAVFLYQAGGGPQASFAPSVAVHATAETPSQVPSPTASSPAEPTIAPTAVGPCAVRQLALVAGGWGGATGSMAGGATVLNVSSEPCRVTGTPRLELRDGDGRAIAGGRPASGDESAVLVPGGGAGVTMVWRNWCGAAPATPLSVRLTLVGGGALTARVIDWSGGIGGAEADSLPRCDTEGSPSTIAAPGAFAVPDLPEPAGDELPCVSTDLAAFLGSWGAAAGTSYASAAVFNQAGEGCLLEGSPPLELRDADGRIVARGEPWPAAGNLVLPAGWAAQTFIGFADWCAAKPKLPLAFALRVGGARLPLVPTSTSSEIGVPACESDPPSSDPDLSYTGPFALPAR
jgi:hypothetical protein